jgi:hypothetical protein
MTDKIDFVCVRPDHQVSTLVEALMIHHEKWAYCPSEHGDGHEWRACGGMSLDDPTASPERAMTRRRPGVQWPL